MKHIIRIADLYGPQIQTRRIMEQLGKSIVAEDEYLFDMQNVEIISRSAADELYNIKQSHHNVEIIHMSSFVQKMYDAVVLGRFQPRLHDSNSSPIIYCPNLQSVINVLSSIQ